MSVNFSSPSIQISKSAIIIFLLTALCLLVLNVILLKQNQEMKAQLTKHTSSPELTTGTQLPSLRGRGVDGKEMQVSFGKDPRKSVLLVFAPECQFCERNMSVWKQILDNINKSSFRVTAVSLSSQNLTNYIAAHQLNAIPVLTDVNLQDRESYKLASVPQTIFIDANGRVEKVWTGLLQGEVLNEVQKDLNMPP